MVNIYYINLIQVRTINRNNRWVKMQKYLAVGKKSLNDLERGQDQKTIL